MKITNIDPIVNMVLNPFTPEEAAVAGFRVMHQQASRYGGLEHMLSRSQVMMDRVARLHEEVAALKEQVGAAQRNLIASQKACKTIAAKQALKVENDLTKRLTIAVRRIISGEDDVVSLADIQAPIHPAEKRVLSKVAASASARSARRVRIEKRRGADSEDMMLKLLTEEFKSISSLYDEAKRNGFTGSEGAIRFAAELPEAWRQCRQGARSRWAHCLPSIHIVNIRLVSAISQSNIARYSSQS